LKRSSKSGSKGAFSSAEEDSLADNRDERAAQIQVGWDEPQRGELTGGENVGTEMQEFKEDWKKRRRSA